MPVCGVDDQHVDAGRDQSRGALERIRATPTAAPQRSRPRSSLQAFGYLIAFWMSLTVIRPFRRKSLSTTRSFSTLCVVQDLACLVERRPHGHREERLRRHHVAGWGG